MTGRWEVEFYKDDSGREPCREWANDLTPVKRAAFLEAVQTVLASRGTDVVKSEFGKALGQGLYELRVRRPVTRIGAGS